MTIEVGKKWEAYASGLRALVDVLGAGEAKTTTARGRGRTASPFLGYTHSPPANLDEPTKNKTDREYERARSKRAGSARIQRTETQRDASQIYKQNTIVARVKNGGGPIWSNAGNRGEAFLRGGVRDMSPFMRQERRNGAARQS